ncbi:MAG: hypothetical protein CBD57_04750 [Candidatus Pelagibacter sp. TMED197]|jgi:hypothetical protein|nr:MAG: hypothetical protein CBD57_04750 [Candidatus Pelagibacter sp. TMED197]|tara:strand:- start:421 stop:1347 length:927 start_codon:yes stop_codon:yes gene_type:complete
MAKYFDEEWPKEEEILNIGLKMSRQNKLDRTKMSRAFCIGNGESRLGFDLERLRPLGTIMGCNALYRDFKPDAIVSVDHGIMHEIYHSGICFEIPSYFRDWTKVPVHLYKLMVEGNISELDVDLIKNTKGVFTSNEKGLAEEFVFHGSKLEGLAHIIKKNKEVIEKKISVGQIKISWIHPKKDKSTSLTDVMGKDRGWACGPSSGYVACETYKAKEVFLIGHDLKSKTDRINNIYKGSKHYLAPENSPTPHDNWVNQWLQLFKLYPNTTFYKVNRDLNLKDNVNQHVPEWEGTQNLFYVDYSSIDNLS